MSATIGFTLGAEGVLFELMSEGARVPLSLPLEDPGHLTAQGLADRTVAQIGALEDLLLDEILLEADPGRWILPTERIYDALERYPEAYQALRLPEEHAMHARLSSRGSLGRTDFELRVDARSDRYGKLEGVARRWGNCYQVGEGEYILAPRPLGTLLHFLDSREPGVEEPGRIERDTAFLAHAKRLAVAAGADLEPWIEGEEYAFPEGIGVAFVQEAEDRIRLIPRAEGVDSAALQRQLERSGGRRPVLTEIDGKRRRRMILSDSDRDVARGLSEEVGVLEGAAIPEFLDTPEAFLPEGVDLRAFSDRVKGIRIRKYHSHPYVTVRERKYDWFPEVGVELEEANEGEGAVDGDDGAPKGMDASIYEELAREALETGARYVNHEGAWIHIDPREAEAFLEARKLEQRFSPEGGTPLPKGAGLEIFQNLEVIEFRGAKPVEAAAMGMDEDALRLVEQFEVPSLLRATLYPHQEFGFRWLMTLDKRCRGGLLADDMGLGKTIQAIGLLAARKEAGRVAPSLLVLRKSLIDNWLEEIQRFCPEITCLPCLGGRFPPASFIEQHDVTLMSYETLRRNVIALGKVNWKVILCDEAQDIKNPTTGRTDAVKAMKAETRVALTGTPVENGLSELWCIMDFVQPPLLGSLREFRTEYEHPITRAKNQQEREQAAQRLMMRMVDHYLRRKKEQILTDLPPKTAKSIEVPLSQSQISEYRQIVAAGRRGGRGALLEALQRLLLLCAHPWPSADAALEKDLEVLRTECPKIGAVMDVLGEVRQKGEKALVFADRKVVHRTLQGVIWKHYGIWAHVINGDLLTGRQQVVKKFNASEGFNVLLLSPRVGGAGLNITGANHVIHYMRPWNPAIENQATDRTHRIGQQKPVHVYHPIATCEEFRTVEQVLDELLQDKNQLATDVLVPSDQLRVKDDEILEEVFG